MKDKTRKLSTKGKVSLVISAILFSLSISLAFFQKLGLILLLSSLLTLSAGFMDYYI